MRRTVSSIILKSIPVIIIKFYSRARSGGAGVQEHDGQRGSAQCSDWLAFKEANFDLAVAPW